MKTCDYCGKDNEETSTHCGGCGTILEVQKEISERPKVPRTLDAKNARIVFLAFFVTTAVLAVAMALTEVIKIALVVPFSMVFGGAVMISLAYKLIPNQIGDASPTGAAWIKGPWEGVGKGLVKGTAESPVPPRLSTHFRPRLRMKVTAGNWQPYQAISSLSGRGLWPIFPRMSIAAEKVAEVLALPERDRAFLARQLIASLDDTVDVDAETQWHEIIDRRSREIEDGKVKCRPVKQVVRDIRKKLHARRQPS